ncbi:MAG: hypothetical protein Q7K37_03380 [Dehalococcoidia bacterium]|nr:hypothetical protein [Dehalococcoidia bacterium]
MKMMPFRSKSPRERAITQAERLAHLGREGGESLLHALPEARERLDELREQARAVLHQIEDMREQAQPAIEEGKRGAAHGKKSFDEGRKGAAHGATAISLASQIEPNRSRGKRPPVLLLLMAAGAIAYVLWKRREGQHADTSVHLGHSGSDPVVL